MASDATKTAVARPLEPGRAVLPSPPLSPPSAHPGGLVDFPAASGSTRFLLFNAAPSWLVSMFFHMVALLVLATIQTSAARDDSVTVLSVVAADEPQEIEQFELPEQMTPMDIQELNSTPVLDTGGSTLAQEAPEIGVALDLDAAPVAMDLLDFGNLTAPKADLTKQLGTSTGSGLEGRGMRMRGEMIDRYGGSKGSEEAVTLALQWFAEHQRQDGSWNFDHRGNRCDGQCRQPGTVKDCYTGATAMALLPFLGAGQTHREGQYRDNVSLGLAYLIRSMKPNGSLMQGGGTMYAHGLAAIALTEAYAMTQDPKLMAPAQAALNFIVFAQDPVGGGWRYQPRQPGDTSVVGWQLMALKSGHMAYLRVPPQTVALASRFLDSVQVERGAKYGYSLPGAKPSTTSIGLLCRMYLGWKQDNEALQRGVEFLGRIGPSDSDMYYNYYATQVMRHWGGETWEKWNVVMREQLVKSQCTEGHGRGSWNVAGGGHTNEKGGRLYFTSMAAMILEVYYRHMPIYGQKAADEEFPL